MRTRTVEMFFIGLIWAFCRAEAQEIQRPKHLMEAQKLVNHLRLENTSYQHGDPKVVWDGTCELHTDCSGFVDTLLSRCYGYDPDAYKRWFDSHRPTARRYHDAIVANHGFTHINHVSEIRPGDFLAIKYLTQKENTGHIMLAAEPPQRINAKKPFIEGTDQWEIKIIDSSRSGHGVTDTRHKKGKNGKDHDGLGEGIFRIYSSKDGTAAGFTWSSYVNSEFKGPGEEHLVIGRLKHDFKP